MDLTCYVLDGWNPRIRPASQKRDWMERTPERYAYRCLPLAIGNSSGWEILSPCGFEARWNGGMNPDDVEIRLDADVGNRAPVPLFGQGTLTFHIEGIIRTPPGWNLWVGGSPNDAKDGISPLGGVIETDWSPYTFTMNWRFTRPNEWIRFEKDEPICFFFPIQRGVVESFEPRIRSMDEAPELREAFQTWSKSRDDFQKWVAETRPTAPADKWQKLYYRGLCPNGEPGVKDHAAKVRVRQFVGLDGKELESPAPPERCPVRSAPSVAAVQAAPAGDMDPDVQAIVNSLMRIERQGQEILQAVGSPKPAAALPAPAAPGKALGHREWILEIAERQRALAAGSDAIEETGPLTAEDFLNRFYATSRPVIMRGAIADWPALKRWTPDYLKQQVGAGEVEFQGGRNNDPNFELYKDNHKHRMPFDGFIDLITGAGGGNDAYLTAYNSASNSAVLAPLEADIGRIGILTGAPGMLWIGPGGTFTPLHFDLTNNLLAQIVGTKHLVLLPPSETPKLANTRHVFSDVHDVTDPECLARYPEAESARQFEVTLEPGDLLYIPVGWWHQVVAEDFSVMQTYTDFRWANDAYEIYPKAG